MKHAFLSPSVLATRPRKLRGLALSRKQITLRSPTLRNLLRFFTSHVKYDGLTSYSRAITRPLS